MSNKQNIFFAMPKKLTFLALFILLYSICNAQYASWMVGTWKSRSVAATAGDVTSTIRVTDVSRESFTGTKTIENNGSHNKIVIGISGYFRGVALFMQDGDVVSKDPVNAQWQDCSSCTTDNSMIIGHDTLVIISSIADCDARCDGTTIYYRLLSDYDSSTQRYLVDRFGRPSDIIGFQPFHPTEEQAAAASEEAKNEIVTMPAVPAPVVNPVKQQPDNKKRLDSLDRIAKAKLQQQKTDDSLRIAQQKKRKQDIADSINLAKQQKHIKDSLDNVAKLEKIKQKTADSLRDVQAKKRQQQISDSLNLAKQQEQKRIKDSLDNVAKLEKIKQKTDDSLRAVQAKKRQQEVADSISLAKQKEQQRIKDSLDNIARMRQQHIDDSTQLAQQKIRQQKTDDSLNLVKQQEQKRIKDSLDNMARLEQIRQRAEDSLRNEQVKKRQKEVADSLNLVEQQKQQRIKDSLQNVAALNLQKQRTADSLRDAEAKKRQQQIADSLAAVRKQQYNDSLQKVALAKAKLSADSTPAQRALADRASVLLGTYHISSPDILIELFDNGEIDGDRVSVYHNNENIVSNQTLGLKAITLNVHADTAHREHEFVMIAENLGTIPPNSALMRITAGKQTYKLTVNTDLKTNARIVLYYDGN